MTPSAVQAYRYAPVADREVDASCYL